VPTLGQLFSGDDFAGHQVETKNARRVPLLRYECTYQNGRKLLKVPACNRKTKALFRKLHRNAQQGKTFGLESAASAHAISLCNWHLDCDAIGREELAVKHDDRRGREELHQLLVRLLKSLADDLGLPRQQAPNEESELKDEEAERIH